MSTELMVVTSVSPGATVPLIVAVCDVGLGVPAVYVPALAGVSEHARVNGAPAPAVTTVTTAAALDATTRLLSGRPEYGSWTVASLIAAAMPAAMATGVSPAATV